VLCAQNPNKFTITMKIRSLIAIPLVAMLGINAQAAFVLVDDMEGANNWSAFDGTPGTIVTDPADSGNNVFSLGFTTHVNQSDSYLSLGAGIAHGTTGTLFFRVRAAANTADGEFDWVFGSTTTANPGATGTSGAGANAWDQYDGYGAMNNKESNGDVDNPMTVRDGTGFNFFGPAAADAWYNVWLVLDNDTKVTTMYYNTGFATPATDPSTVSATGAFRTPSNDDLINLWVRNNSGDGAIGYIDDVWLDTTGANLANPVPEPSISLLVGLFAALSLLRRRR